MLKSDRYPTILELALHHYKSGAFREALSLIEGIGPITELDHALLHVAGLSAFRLNQLVEAKTLFKEAIGRASDSAITWNALGEALRQSGEHLDALRAFQRAIEIEPGMADAFSNLGNLYGDVSDEESAVASYRSAISIDAQHLDAWFNLANLLFKFERYSGALEAYQKVLELKPEHRGALNNYGVLLHHLRQYAEAKGVLEHLLSMTPVLQDGVISYARLLGDLEDDRGALAFIDKSVPTVTQIAAAQLLLIRARICAKGPDRELTRAAYNAALERDSSLEEAERGLINLDLASGNFVSAKRRLEELSKRRPGDLGVDFARCFCELKPVYESEEDLVATRSVYERSLRDLTTRLENLKDEELFGVEDIIGSSQPFLLPYQARDNRELQKRYGEAISAVMRRAIAPPPLVERKPLAGRKIRVGFISGFFRNHSNYKIPIQGWLRALQDSGFEVFCYYTQAITDACTEEAQLLSHRFEQGARSIREWVRLILGDELDVIIYPEIGMDPISCKLACLRLAPCQAASWGHPETSGLPTIDYFLSSDRMEPGDGDRFYTEQLVRLSNLSFSYQPAQVTSSGPSRATFGLAESDVVFWCPQTCYKYLPQHDWIFPEIAKGSPQAKFIFVLIQPQSESSEIFRARIDRAFRSRGLEVSDFVRYTGPLDGAEFRAVAGLSDIGLDTFEWSGCNSTLETLAAGTPIITCPGSFMRSRHTAAILQMIGCEELIVSTAEEYVRLAGSLAQDPERRLRLRAFVRQVLSRAYGDPACAQSLKDALTTRVSQSLTEPSI